MIFSLYEKFNINFPFINLLAGRLYQVEYAMEAISHAGAAIGVTCSEGIVLAAEKKITWLSHRPVGGLRAIFPYPGIQYSLHTIE